MAQYSKGKTEYTYDGYNRLVEEKFYTGARNSSVAPTLIKSISYIYDDFGNVINKTITENEQQVIYHYEYDNLFRLTKYCHYFRNGTYDAYEEEAYTYDCMGNRTKLSREQQYTFEDGLETWTVDYTYNNVNQLLTEIKTQGEETVYSYTYTYDDNGNSLTDPKTGNVMTYDYFRNKPITITGTDGTITYTYNSKGELISRSKTQNETTITNTYFWDENGYMINEGDGTSITHSNLVGLNGIFARFDGTGATYYGKNAHGDVIYTQNNLTITKYYDYDPFGNETNPDPNDTNPFRYCGEYFDVHSGTYYLRNRYYYPRLGRFTTIDPIRSGQNWYVYCGNNPVIFIDPLGLSSKPPAWMDWNSDGVVDTKEDHARFDSNNNNIADWREIESSSDRYKTTVKEAYSLPNYNYLEIEHVKDIGKNSCWGGPSVMAVEHFTQKEYGVRQYVEDALLYNGKSLNSTSYDLYPGEIIGALNKALVDTSYSAEKINNFSFIRITNEIDSNRPIIALEKVTGKLSHAVLIQGYAYSDDFVRKMVVVNDPATNKTRIEFFEPSNYTGYIIFEN